MPSIYVRCDTKAVEDNVNRIIGKKLKSALYGNARNDIAGKYAEYIAKYVPYKSGKLLKSATVSDGEVRYSAKAKSRRGNFDYAKYQYDTPFPQSSRSTPGTYDHWNRHLSTAERQAFYEDVAKIIVEKMNNG